MKIVPQSFFVKAKKHDFRNVRNMQKSLEACIHAQKNAILWLSSDAYTKIASLTKFFHQIFRERPL